MGAGISLACLNIKVYREWCSIVKKFRDAGWGENSIEAYLTSKNVVQDHFKNPNLSVIILEGTADFG